MKKNLYRNIILLLFLSIGIIATLDINTGVGFNAPELLDEEVGIQDSQLTIVDSRGRNVTVNFPLQKVVVINPPAAEVIRALGVDSDVVVGISQTIADSPEFYPNLYDKTVVSSSAHSEPNYENIFALNETVGGIDAVIFYGTHGAVNSFFNTMVATLDPIPVVGLDCYKVSTLFDDIEKMGHLFGSIPAATQFIDFLNGTKNFVVDKVSGIAEENKTQVYMESHSGDYKAAASRSSLTELIELAGGFNIFGNISASTTTVSPEDILLLNPDVMLVETRISSVPLGYGLNNITPIQTYLDTIYTRATADAWNVVDAVKNGDVYLLSQHLLAGPKKYFGMAYMAKIFYPDLFEDGEVEAIFEEFLVDYQGLPLNGIFVYPEVSTPTNTIPLYGFASGLLLAVLTPIITRKRRKG